MGFMPCNIRSLLPFVGMVVAMLAQASNMEVTKLALSQGINKYVIIVYSDALSTLVLLPCSFIIHRSDRTPLDFSLLCKFFLLSVFGWCAQICGYVGLQYSSPTLGTAMLNLIPAFTFILAIIFRLEKLDRRSKSSIAKSLGTIVSIAGAFVVTFYKGPTVFGIASHIKESHQLFHSPQFFWMIGALFLAAEALMDSAWYILQTFILKKFPAVLIIICYLCFFNTVLSAIFALIVVEDRNSWKIKPNIGLATILYTVNRQLALPIFYFGLELQNCCKLELIELVSPEFSCNLQAVIGLAFRISLVAWCLSRTGPLYVTLFKPLAIIFVVIMDAIILGDPLCLGSLIGAIIIVTGFYWVMWGKAKEEKAGDDSAVGSCESSSDNVPLLGDLAEEI
ncbi:WAT1-related protein At4g15540 [Ricinus communis]|uniref:WAT1-related protein At4g15540 n=1 Tax=Ricinus communis TaxID=3988 RepID=UPI00201AD089|nr:WAT1-related protein At4g15540 [Ricinus communis]